MNNVKIKMDDLGIGTIEVDGEPMKGIRSTRFESVAGQAPILHLDRITQTINLDGVAEVQVVNICASCRQELNINAGKFADDRAGRAAYEFIQGTIHGADTAAWESWNLLEPGLRVMWKGAAAAAIAAQNPHKA